MISPRPVDSEHTTKLQLQQIAYSTSEMRKNMTDMSGENWLNDSNINDSIKWIIQQTPNINYDDVYLINSLLLSEFKSKLEAS